MCFSHSILIPICVSDNSCSNNPTNILLSLLVEVIALICGMIPDENEAIIAIGANTIVNAPDFIPYLYVTICWHIDG